MEEWREILGNTEYEVSNLGRVRRKLKKDGSCLKQSPNSRGYLRVNIKSNSEGRHMNKFVHRLVGIAFIPNPLNKEDINHIDGNKLNNNLENLEWATRQENIIHAWETGLSKPRKRAKTA